MAHVHGNNVFVPVPHNPNVFQILVLGQMECQPCGEIFIKIQKLLSRLQKMEERFRQAQGCALRQQNACEKCSSRYTFWLLKIRHDFVALQNSFNQLILLPCCCSLKKQTRARTIEQLDNFSALICHSPLSENQIRAAPPVHIVYYNRV